MARYPLDNYGSFKTGLTFGQPYPASFGSLAGKHHLGVDKICPVGTPIKAPVDGTIVFVGQLQEGGLTTHLRDYFGQLWRFMHQSRQIAVQGQQVASGGLLGLSGDTGISTAPHLHYDLFKNASVPLTANTLILANFLDPEAYIKAQLTNTTMYEGKTIIVPKDKDKFYLVQGGAKHWSPDVLTALSWGLIPEDGIPVDKATADGIPTGSQLQYDGGQNHRLVEWIRTHKDLL